MRGEIGSRGCGGTGIDRSTMSSSGLGSSPSCRWSRAQKSGYSAVPSMSWGRGDLSRRHSAMTSNLFTTSRRLSLDALRVRAFRPGGRATRLNFENYLPSIEVVDIAPLPWSGQPFPGMDSIDSTFGSWRWIVEGEKGRLAERARQHEGRLRLERWSHRAAPGGFGFGDISATGRLWSRLCDYIASGHGDKQAAAGPCRQKRAPTTSAITSATRCSITGRRARTSSNNSHESVLEECVRHPSARIQRQLGTLGDYAACSGSRANSTGDSGVPLAKRTRFRSSPRCASMSFLVRRTR